MTKEEAFKTPIGSPERVTYALNNMMGGMIKLFDDMKDYAKTLSKEEQEKFWKRMTYKMGSPL